MKILHLNRFSYSGQTTHVFSLVKEQQKQGHLVHLVLEGYPSLKALDVYKQTIKRLNVTLTRPSDDATLGHLIKRFKYDVIHAHSSLTFAMAYKLSRLYNIPYVITCHGLGLNKEEFRPFLAGAARIFCISPRVANSVHEFADKVNIIANGVDLDEYKPAKKNQPVKIALVTRIDAGKQDGYYHLCKAIDLIESTEFYVASNKPPVSTKAKYLGWTDDIAALMAKTDVVVGTGRSIVEGLAAGNAGLVLGRTYQGLLTPEKLESQQFLDLSGLSGSDPCYKDIFFDLSKLTGNDSYLRKIQDAGRKFAEKYFDNSMIAKFILHEYRVLYNGF